jgi:hypothetical protein
MGGQQPACRPASSTTDSQIGCRQHTTTAIKHTLTTSFCVFCVLLQHRTKWNLINSEVKITIFNFVLFCGVYNWHYVPIIDSTQATSWVHKSTRRFKSSGIQHHADLWRVTDVLKEPAVSVFSAYGCLNMKAEGAGNAEMSVTFCQSTRRYVSEDSESSSVKLW